MTVMQVRSAAIHFSVVHLLLTPTALVWLPAQMVTIQLAQPMKNAMHQHHVPVFQLQLQHQVLSM
jgi:hypothetical protein